MTLKCYDLLKDDNGYPMLLMNNCKEYSITDYNDVVNFIIDHYNLRNLMEEYVCLIALDNGLHIKGIFELSHGGFDSAICGIKEVFCRLLLVGATGFILVHNHVSGNSSPSKYDIQISKKFAKASELMEFKYYDFIIIGDEVTSFKDKDLL